MGCNQPVSCRGAHGHILPVDLAHTAAHGFASLNSALKPKILLCAWQHIPIVFPIGGVANACVSGQLGLFVVTDGPELAIALALPCDPSRVIGVGHFGDERLA